jgi:hypothetical protein
VDSNVKAKDLDRLMPQLAGQLVEGEQPVLLMGGGSMRPLVDLLLVTSARLMAFQRAAVAAGPRFEGRPGFSTLEADGRKLRIRNSDGTELVFAMSKDDVARTVATVHGQPAPDPAVWAALSASAMGAAATGDAWAKVLVVGEVKTVNKPTWKALRDAAYGDEVPIFVITGVGGAGVLAAFEDRCMIVKAGVMTGLMAGSLGGSRQATFHYAEITGIEFNSGMLSGVLEVLTPSYQGTANKDYWRGSTKSRNADSNDPWTLSNCLPLSKGGHASAQAEINELRRRIGQSKQMQVVIQGAATPVSSEPTLAGELAKLADLRQQGLLDDAEFAEAKRAVLARFA